MAWVNCHPTFSIFNLANPHQIHLHLLADFCQESSGLNMKDVIDLVGIWLREPPLDPATFGSNLIFV